MIDTSIGDGLPPELHSAEERSWLFRQLLLVPEAAVLLCILGLHSIFGTSALLTLFGIIAATLFSLRLSFLALGRHAVATADYEQAARLTGLAHRLYPYSADTHALQATILLARGRPDEAAATFVRAIELFPTHAAFYAALSGALLEASRAEEAGAAARRALQLDPRSAAAHLHLAGAAGQLGAQPAEVEAHLRAGLALKAPLADQAALRCALADLLIANGRQSEAQLTIVGTELLLTNCPAAYRAGLHFYLGELLRRSGDNDNARRHYRASETLDPHGRYAAAAWRAARS